MSEESRLHFSVLGPLAARIDDEDRTPTASMPRKVLALLLLRANETVPVSTLLDELWEGDELPRLARKTVQTYIYQLRRTLGAAEAPGRSERVIVSRQQSYELRLRTGQFDLWEFDRLASAGRGALERGLFADAAVLLQDAMDVWRGPALADIEPGNLLSVERARLEDRRDSVLELRIDADLRLGRHRALVGELEALAASRPMNEGFHAQLMIAAHLCGRRRDALDAYQRLRRHLIDEIGLEPGERLRRLHQEILADTLDFPQEAPRSAALGAEPCPAAQLPPDTVDFVGRDVALRQVQDRCVTASADRPGAIRLITVTGEPGIGKSTFAVHAAHRLRRHFPDGQLWASLHDVAERPVDPRTVLAEFLLATGLPPDRLPAGVEARSAMFRTWAADRSVLLVLDDAAGVDQIRPLLPAGEGCAVIVTSRDRLSGLAGATTLALGPLDEDAGAGLLAQVVGAGRVRPEWRCARGCVRACHGLPLAVRAAGEKLAVRPPWTLAKMVGRLLDPDRCLDELGTRHLDLRAYLLRAWRRLDDRHREAMRTLCALDPVFDLRSAAEALGMTPLEAESPVGYLVERHLLAVVATTDEGDALFQFPPLLRLAVLPDLGSRVPRQVVRSCDGLVNR
jgi:DNA-binding SARP family transcriptional activator